MIVSDGSKTHAIRVDERAVDRGNYWMEYEIIKGHGYIDEVRFDGAAWDKAWELLRDWMDRVAECERLKAALGEREQ